MSFEATLENYLYAIDNVSGETAFLLEEIGHIDSRVQETRHEIIKRDVTEIQRHIKRNGLLSENPKEAGHVEKIRSDYARIAKLSDEKVALAERGVRMLDKYVQKLQGEFERLKEMGHNIGDTDTAPVTNAGLAGLGSPGVGGFPQLDMSSATNSNKKRKLPSVNTQMHNGQMYASPTSAQLQAYQNNPYMQQLQQGNGNMQYPGQSGSSSAYNQFGNSPLSAQQQQQLALQLQNAYTNGGQLPSGQGPSGPGSGANNASRPHRPSRLSSSFSANGLGAGTQILPSTTAAHLPPGSGTPTTAAMLNGQAGVKRARPSGTAGNSQKNNKKKKRIQISDEESVLDEAMSVEDVDAEGEDDEGEEDRSLLSVGNGGPRRPGTLKAGSRQGTPSASSLLGNGGNNAGRPKNAATNKQARGQLQPLAPFPAFQARSAEEDAEGEEEDADAEGEEDFGLELDDANTEDPTLYCFCQRVSYGNMIACDNLDCKYEWFHWACVKVTKQPDDNEKWYCPECRKTMADKATGASTPKPLTMSAGSTAYAQLQMQQQLMLQNQGSAGGASRSNRRG